MESPKEYFVPNGTAAMKRYREKNKYHQENSDLIQAIFDGEYGKAKYHFSENVLKRLQGAIDKGARRGGEDMTNHIFGEE